MNGRDEMGYLKDLLHLMKTMSEVPPKRYYTIERDIQALIREEGMSYEEAYRALSVYLTLGDYIDFQSSRGVPQKMARKTYLNKGPSFSIFTGAPSHFL